MEPAYINLAVLLSASGLFLFGLACVIYVAFRFLALVLSLDAAILKEFQMNTNAYRDAARTNPIQESKLKDFIQSRMAPTDGDFIPVSDEEAFLQEQITELRGKGLTDEELEAFVRQAVSDKV
jgi:hypothetical protein